MKKEDIQYIIRFMKKEAKKAVLKIITIIGNPFEFIWYFMQNQFYACSLVFPKKKNCPKFNQMVGKMVLCLMHWN